MIRLGRQLTNVEVGNENRLKISDTDIYLGLLITNLNLSKYPVPVHTYTPSWDHFY